MRALVLLEGDALGLSPAALEWTRAIRARLRAVATRDGVGAVYEALIDEVVGEGAWDWLPKAVRRVLAGNGPALLAELHYVDEVMPDAAAFATIDKPVLLVAASPLVRGCGLRAERRLASRAAAVPHYAGGHISLSTRGDWGSAGPQHLAPVVQARGPRSAAVEDCAWVGR